MSYLTLPNVLSIARGVCGPFFLWAAVTENWLIAFSITCYAVVSDLIDGPLARRLNQTTPHGARIDHTSDAVFVFCGLLSFGSFQHNYLPFVLAFAQLLAFIEYSFLGARGKSILQASRLGRYNGILYFVLIAALTTQLAWGFNWIPYTRLYFFGWLLFASTVVSLILRLFSRYAH